MPWRVARGGAPALSWTPRAASRPSTPLPQVREVRLASRCRRPSTFAGGPVSGPASGFSRGGSRHGCRLRLILRRCIRRRLGADAHRFRWRSGSCRIDGVARGRIRYGAGRGWIGRLPPLAEGAGDGAGTPAGRPLSTLMAWGLLLEGPGTVISTDCSAAAPSRMPPAASTRRGSFGRSLWVTAAGLVLQDSD